MRDSDTETDVENDESASTSANVVIIIGCGMQKYREYLLASAGAHHDVWLFTDEPPTWQAPYILGCTVVDLYDRAGVIATARALSRTLSVVGVLSWDETLIVTTAHVAAELGLPGAGIEGIEGCRDKLHSRQVLSAAGLAQPRFAWVASADEAVRAAQQNGYPVVLKPRGMGASIGVVLARDEQEVREAFATAEASSFEGALAYQGGALVEEYLAGEEISIDAAVVEGDYRVMFLARKRVGLYPYFEELGHTVDADDVLLKDGDLLAMLKAAHQAIGLQSAITHTEVKLTPGGPVIVEINGRLGGDLIPLLGKLATGIDPGVAVVDVAMGVVPDLTATGSRVTGVRFGYPVEDCVVTSLALPRPGTPAGLLMARDLVEPGAELRLPPGGYIARYCYLIATATSATECDLVLDKAADAITVTWTALPARAQSASFA